MKGPKISAVVPIYNEEKTVEPLLQKVLQALQEQNFEILAVNDGSSDATGKILSLLQTQPAFKNALKVFHLPQNSGKGEAVRFGLRNATGDIVIIQDADLEYDPGDYHSLISRILNGSAEVVYGSRFLNKNHPFSLWYFANWFLTRFTNLLYGSSLTDMETCYKAMKKSVLENITLRARKFDLEPELTAKLLRKKIQIHEIPISYHGRNYHEGKKITWKDGLTAMWTLCKYRLF